MRNDGYTAAQMMRRQELLRAYLAMPAVQAVPGNVECIEVTNHLGALCYWPGTLPDDADSAVSDAQFCASVSEPVRVTTTFRRDTPLGPVRHRAVATY